MLALEWAPHSLSLRGGTASSNASSSGDESVANSGVGIFLFKLCFPDAWSSGPYQSALPRSPRRKLFSLISAISARAAGLR